MQRYVKKRNGDIVPFNHEKITWAIYKAASAVGGSDYDHACALTDEVILLLQKKNAGQTYHVEEIQDAVEKVLIENGHAKTAKAYILYREKRRNARENNALIGATVDMFSEYLNGSDFEDARNSYRVKSVNGMNQYIRETFTKQYWLHSVYPESVRRAHISGDIYIHDLGFFGPNSSGWDLKLLLTRGFGGSSLKIESKPARHFRSFLGQIVNSTYATQCETAASQSWSSFDTYCAPFIRYDGLDYPAVKQAVQEFIFNLNIPIRVGFQCPFTNISLDFSCPEKLAGEQVILGGKLMKETYGEFGEEIEMFNRAFFEVMGEGDSNGNVFTFPVTTINITENFRWDSPAAETMLKVASKFGVPYFSNCISGEGETDCLSSACRRTEDLSVLHRRGVGLFGSNPLSGSIGVVSVNLPRIAYISQSKEDFFRRLDEILIEVKNCLELKRKTIEEQTENGIYPFSSNYLSEVKNKFGEYWHNHFSSIGIVGMNEAARNLYGKDTDITTPLGHSFAKETLDFIRKRVLDFQKETGHYFCLEAPLAEKAAGRFASLDTLRFGDIVTSGGSVPYYTNSSRLPVDFSEDIFECLELEEELQKKYNGNTVFHVLLGREIEDTEVTKKLIRTILKNYDIPSLSVTPTFSICKNHGYLPGEQKICPHCGKDTVTWSKTVGYFLPLQYFNSAKKEEYLNKKCHIINEEELKRLY